MEVNSSHHQGLSSHLFLSSVRCVERALVNGLDVLLSLPFLSNPFSSTHFPLGFTSPFEGHLLIPFSILILSHKFALHLAHRSWSTYTSLLHLLKSSMSHVFLD